MSLSVDAPCWTKFLVGLYSGMKRLALGISVVWVLLSGFFEVGRFLPVDSEIVFDVGGSWTERRNF